jgi:hypothetical protein
LTSQRSPYPITGCIWHSAHVLPVCKNGPELPEFSRKINKRLEAPVGLDHARASWPLHCPDDFMQAPVVITAAPKIAMGVVWRLGWMARA